MKKEYTFEDFKPNTYAYKTITEGGRRSSVSGRFDVNYSGILSQLIQEAGRYCESFASDLFIDWESVRDYIEEAEDEDAHTFLFGFRQRGVDGASFIFSRYESEGDYAKSNYRSLWRLDITTSGGDMTLELGRVF